MDHPSFCRNPGGGWLPYPLLCDDGHHATTATASFRVALYWAVHRALTFTALSTPVIPSPGVHMSDACKCAKTLHEMHAVDYSGPTSSRGRYFPLRNKKQILAFAPACDSFRPTRNRSEDRRPFGSNRRAPSWAIRPCRHPVNARSSSARRWRRRRDCATGTAPFTSCAGEAGSPGMTLTSTTERSADGYRQKRCGTCYCKRRQ